LGGDRRIDELTTSGPRNSSSPTAPIVVPTLVTDDDRHRFGLLLDRAAERGLLSTHEYELRLGDLAAADTLDEMARIVSELPVFAGLGRPIPQAKIPSAKRSSRVRSPAEPTPVVGAPMAASPPRHANRWVMLVVVVLVVVAALVFLAAYARHMADTRSNGVAAPALVLITPRL
jgi:hypothetical protein